MDNGDAAWALHHDDHMTPDEIALDPTFPLCWEDTETLRIGFDRAEVRLRAPSPAAQRFVDKLRTGLHQRELTA